MALEGNLKDFGLADILQLIFFQRKTGVLTLRGHVDSVRLSFLEGNVVMAISKRREKSARVGRMLIQRGFISEEDLDRALESSRGSAERLGKILYSEGKIGLEDLVEIVSAQMAETVVQLFSWRKGHYEFVAQDVVIDPDVGVSLDTEHLLMEGLRITDEWSLLNGRVDLDATYDKVAGAAGDDLDESERTVLSLLDGQTDVNSIMDLSILSQLDTAKAIVSLEDKGVIATKPPTEVSHEQITKKGAGIGIALAKIAIAKDTVFYSLAVLVLGLMVAFTINNSLGIANDLGHYAEGVGLEKLRLQIEMFRAETGVYPGSLDELNELPPAVFDHKYVYHRREGGRGFILIGLGPDGIEGSKDDIK